MTFKHAAYVRIKQRSSRLPTAMLVASMVLLASSAYAAAPEVRSRPEDVPDHPHGPPPEAYEACEGMQRDDPCIVYLRQHEIEGTCQADRGNETLFCLPDRMPPRPPRPQG